MDDSCNQEMAQLISLADAYSQKRARELLIESRMSPEELYHYQQKKALGGRIQVCKVLLLKYYRARKPKEMTERVFQKKAANKLDNLLAKHKYDIEYIIDKWREISPNLAEYEDICFSCGYRPPFCGYLWDGSCSYRLDKEDYA
jgi:hypothetical protein